MPAHAPSLKVAAAFAQERDASYAVRLIASVSAVDIRYTLRRVLGETGDMQMVVLEAAFPDQAMASHVESAMTGAHGVLIPVDVLEDRASRAS